jgi:hypothetical protein
MVAYPRKGSDDIGVAIRYAVKNSKKVQARSDGHQYCGLSSGGDDTILLSMDLYIDIEVSERLGRWRQGRSRLVHAADRLADRRGTTSTCLRLSRPPRGNASTGGYPVAMPHPCVVDPLHHGRNVGRLGRRTDS